MDSTFVAVLPSNIEVTPHADEGFDIMANVIWPEIGQAIMDEMGLVVFAAGKPDEFLKVVYFTNHGNFTYTLGRSVTRQLRHLYMLLNS